MELTHCMCPLWQSYGGIRGAVSFSLAILLNEDNFPLKKTIVTTTITVVMFTVFIQVRRTAHGGLGSTSRDQYILQFLFSVMSIKFGGEVGQFYPLNGTTNPFMGGVGGGGMSVIRVANSMHSKKKINLRRHALDFVSSWCVILRVC